MSATGGHSSAGDRSPPVVGGFRIGAELRAARERLGWSVPDVSSKLHIRTPYLEAIEDGRLADLPGNTYAIGFIRSYATSLGLDATEIARRFRAETQDVNRTTELSFPAPVRERSVPAGAVVLLGLVIAAGSYAAWYRLSGDAPDTAAIIPPVPERLAPLAESPPPPPQVASPAPPPPVIQPPAAVAEPAAPPAPDAPRVLLRFKADAYIQLRERFGPVLLNRVMRTGETWPVPLGAPLLLTTGNAGGTELVVEGTLSPALGPSGAVRRDLPIDPDAIQPGEALVSTPRAPTQ